jgi:hypothetical protein
VRRILQSGRQRKKETKKDKEGTREGNGDRRKRNKRKKTKYLHVGFEVFTAVVLKSIFFWDMTPCSALSGTRRFGGTYRLHLPLACSLLR